MNVIGLVLAGSQIRLSEGAALICAINVLSFVCCPLLYFIKHLCLSERIIDWLIYVIF